MLLTRQATPQSVKEAEKDELMELDVVLQRSKP